MNKHSLILWLIVFSISMFSCAETEKDKVTRLVREMDGKQIVFPDDIIYTVYGTDTVNYVVPEQEYTIVSYIDSIGCTSCKLQLHRWKEFINEMDSLSGNLVSFRFIFHPKDKKELNYLFKRDKFDVPVWIDQEDSFNKMNKLPENDTFHTFLLDDNSKIIAIGNPVNNPKIKELYHQIIFNAKPVVSDNSVITEIEIDKRIIDMGEFDWKESRKEKISLKNVGNQIFVINDIIASCGCIHVDYSNEPIKPGRELEINIIYKAENPEYFSKVIKIYANTKDNPIELTVKGISK